MRWILMLPASCFAAAATPAVQAPPPAPPRLIQIAMPQVAWWNSAERARIASRSPFSIPGAALDKPRPWPLLLPYPDQAPPHGRSYFLLQ